MPRNTSGLRRGPGMGRPRGARNKVTQDIREFSRTFLEDPVGVAKLRAAYRKGNLHPAIHIRLMEYAYGKPKQTVELEGSTREALHVIITNDISSSNEAL